MRDRPFLDFRGLGYRLAQCGAGQAITSFVRPYPDQVAIKFHKDIFRRAAPPGIIVIDFALERRYEPRHFFRLSGIGDIENAYARVEPGNYNERRIGSAGRKPALRVVRTKTPAREAEIRVWRVG